MELRICEVDEGAWVETLRQAQGPGSVSELAELGVISCVGLGFLFCSVSELVELAVISSGPA